MQFRLADIDLTWTGSDDTIPSGCVLGYGRDPLGNTRLFLWRGDQPADETFLGSVLMRDGRTSIAYGPRGAFVGAGGEGTLLDRLAAT